MNIQQRSACICRRRRLSRAAVVLAASRGRGLEAVTSDRPKVMLPIAGKPLLRWLMDGFKKETYQRHHRRRRLSSGCDRHRRHQAGRSMSAMPRPANWPRWPVRSIASSADTVISYGDLLFRSYVLRDLVESEADFAVVIDSSPSDARNRTVRDFAYCSRGDDRGLFGTQVS